MHLQHFTFFVKIFLRGDKMQNLFENIHPKNIEKLKSRYPDGFKELDSINIKCFFTYDDKVYALCDNTKYLIKIVSIILDSLYEYERNDSYTIYNVPAVINVDGGVNEVIYLDTLSKNLNINNPEFKYYYLNNSYTNDEWAERDILLDNATINNLISACIDNELYWGNRLNLDPNKIVFKRCLDLKKSLNEQSNKRKQKATFVKMQTLRYLAKLLNQFV